MTIIVRSASILLEGHCPVEEAETLLSALQEKPKRKIDVTGLAGMHTAVAQILLINRTAIVGTPANAFVAAIILPALGWSGQTK